MFTYHVTCGMEKKIVSIDCKDRASVLGALRNTFAVEEGFHLQLWDSDFCDWLDVMDTEMLPDKAKLLLTVPGQL